MAAGLVEDAVGEILNIGNSTEVTIAELAEMTVRLSGSKSEIIYVPQQQVYGNSYEDVPRRVPDTTKMEQVLGVRADTPLEEGLRHTIEHFRHAAGGHGAGQ
jgi:UDP-glucose 4-epimerase